MSTCGCGNKNDTGFRQKFIVCTQERESDAVNKISVVGAGRVGSAMAYTFLTQGLTNDLCLIDVKKEYVEAQAIDLLHASAGFKDAKIVGSTDFKDTANSKIVVISVGRDGKTQSTRMELLESSVDIMKKIMPEIMKYSKEPILFVVTNPVDVITYVAWKLSGLPKTKIIGSGTLIDTHRLRYHIAKKLNVGSSSVQGWMLGEHGDTMVPIWSSFTVGGVKLADVNPKIGQPDDPEKFGEVYETVRAIGLQTDATKGSTEWAISASAVKILRSILFNTNEIHPAGVCVKGLYDIQDDVFMSLPVIFGNNGVTDIVKYNLTDDELEKIKESAKYLLEMQKNAKI